MAWSYRKRIKIAPGIIINLSKSCISATLGVKGFNVNIGKNGAFLNAGFPGTGIYNRKRLSGAKPKTNSSKKYKPASTKRYRRASTPRYVYSSVPKPYTPYIASTKPHSVSAIHSNNVSTPKSVSTTMQKRPKNIQDDYGCGCAGFILVLTLMVLLNYWTYKTINYQSVIAGLVVASICWGIYYLFCSSKSVEVKDKVVTEPTEPMNPVMTAEEDKEPEPEEQQMDVDNIVCSTPSDPISEASSLYSQWKTSNIALLTSVVTKLYDFQMRSTELSEVRNMLNKMFSLSNKDGSACDIDTKIKVAILTDVLLCYKRLGYELGKNQMEEFGILLFTVKTIKPSFEVTMLNAEEICETLLEPARKVLDLPQKLIEHIHIPQDQYIFQHVYEKIDKDILIQYLVHLHRFASAIAKADGNIDARESRILSDLLYSMDFATDGKPLFPQEEFLPENEFVKQVVKFDLEHPGKYRIIQNAEAEESHSLYVSTVSPLDELSELIGLDNIKIEVEKLYNYVKVMKARKEKGLAVTPISYHCVFTGNPGTGKTTVARIIARIYQELGVIKEAKFIETDRSGLVAEYIGQTAVKTNKIIDSALDGVLFIDEAYSLANCGERDYGNEAISTLLKRMEDDRNRLVVILAGYGNEMKQFIDSNPGLQSRFNRYIQFSDYNADQLFEIFKKNVKDNDYQLTPDAEEYILSYLQEAVEHKDINFGNARFVRNIFERTLQNQAMRISPKTDLSMDILRTIEKEDIK